MAITATKTKTVTGMTPDRIPFDEFMAAGEAVIMKGVALDWPLVKAGLKSPQAAMNHLLAGYEGRPVTVFTGEPEIGGRFHYDENVKGLNFVGGRAPLGDVLGQILGCLNNPQAPSYYVGSTDLDQFFPGWNPHDRLRLDHAMFARVISSVWIGNRTTAQCHFDMSYNLAVCAVGHRRFTLFPSEQVANLYPGPLEPTPGGQVVSMVDFRSPDFERFPRFRDALAAAQVAEMEPGDVLYYPAMWWHHVEALDTFNTLVNYWWNPSPAFMDTPMNTLLHGLLSLRDRPQSEKDAWRNLFDYYVFGPSEVAGAHLPDHARGPLAPLDDMAARRLRAMLLNKLNR